MLLFTERQRKAISACNVLISHLNQKRCRVPDCGALIAGEHGLCSGHLLQELSERPWVRCYTCGHRVLSLTPPETCSDCGSAMHAEVTE